MKYLLLPLVIIFKAFTLFVVAMFGALTGHAVPKVDWSNFIVDCIVSVFTIIIMIIISLITILNLVDFEIDEKN